MSRLLEVDYEKLFAHRKMFHKAQVINLLKTHGEAQDTQTYKIAFDEGVKKATDACESTFSEMLKTEKAKSVKANNKKWVEWLENHCGVPTQKKHPDARKYFYCEAEEWELLEALERSINNGKP